MYVYVYVYAYVCACECVYCLCVCVCMFVRASVYVCSNVRKPKPTSEEYIYCISSFSSFLTGTPNLFNLLTFANNVSLVLYFNLNSLLLSSKTLGMSVGTSEEQNKKALNPTSAVTLRTRSECAGCKSFHTNLKGSNECINKHFGIGKPKGNA